MDTRAAVADKKTIMAEIEAKFLIRQPERVDQILAGLADHGYVCAEGETRMQVDTYFDTPDFAILHAGWTYRCRQSGGHSTLNLKSSGTKQGEVFIREEIEQPLADDAPAEIGRLPPGPVQERLESIVDGKRKHKLFSVTSRRRVFSIGCPGNPPARLELDLDRTRIVARKAVIDAPGRFDFMELEVEHASGDTGAVDTLARILRDQFGLAPAQFSKFDRGIQAAGLSIADSSMKHREPDSKGTDRFLGLLYRHLGHYAGMLRKYQPLASEGLHPEGVHKMRVAIRHLRAMLRTYARIFASNCGDSLDTELRWLARQLGRARDADVNEMEIRRFNASLPLAAAVAAAPYEEHLREVTVAAYMNLTELFAGEQYAGLLAKLDSFIAGGPDSETRKEFGNLSISEAADRDVPARAHGMLKRGDRISAGSPAKKLHRLRIRAKRLRYLLDFFSVAQPVRWSAPVAALERLQDLLGTHQDAITARERLEQFAASLPAAEDGCELRLSIGRLIHTQDDRIAECRRRFPAAWSRFRKTFDHPTMIITQQQRR